MDQVTHNDGFLLVVRCSIVTRRRKLVGPVGCKKGPTDCSQEFEAPKTASTPSSLTPPFWAKVAVAIRSAYRNARDCNRIGLLVKSVTDEHLADTDLGSLPNKLTELNLVILGSLFKFVRLGRADTLCTEN